MEIVSVDLPRPRKGEIVLDNSFLKIKREILPLIEN